MKKLALSLIFVSFLFFIATAQKVVDKTFKVKETVTISTVSGDCIIKKGNENEIKVHLSYTYDDDCFSPEFNEESDLLEIKEEFDGNCSGKSEWTITVPENTNVKFNSASGDGEITGVAKSIYANTASGDIKLSNLKGEVKINSASGDVKLNKVNADLKINTASGDIEAENLEGKVKINTASGDIDIKNANAELKVNSASGEIEAENIVISSKSSFNTASGDVEVSLAKSSSYDLTLSSASGDVTLDYNGNDLNGFYEFTARVKKGKIISPVKFDREEVITKNGKKYDVKSFTKGNSTPIILIKTSSGTAKLVK